MKGHGRPQGTEYDYLLDDLADIILASGGVKSINQAMRERFTSDVVFHGASPETAARRFRKIWKERDEILLAEAAERAQKKAIEDITRKANQYLIEEAMELKKLAKGKAPYSDTFAMPITLFLERVTPADYEKNPHVRLFMSFGEFQTAHERRAVLAKLRGK